MNETFSTNEQASIAQFPTIRREDAQRFLNVLDDRTARFTFMVFDDNQSRKDKRLANIRHGTLDALYSELVDYSRRGAGVFVTINETNFRGRRKECIVRVRFYFADLDGAALTNEAGSLVFETRDFYLACFLRCAGYDLMDLRAEGRRKVFVFRDRRTRRSTATPSAFARWLSLPRSRT
jgi:hypothetical protein